MESRKTIGWFVLDQSIVNLILGSKETGLGPELKAYDNEPQSN